MVWFSKDEINGDSYSWTGNTSIVCLPHEVSEVEEVLNDALYVLKKKLIKATSTLWYKIKPRFQTTHVLKLTFSVFKTVDTWM